MTAIAYTVVERARAAGVLLATAESCTAGLVAAALTDVPGSSAVFDRGFVTYSNAAKHEMLGVPIELIETHGAVSAEVAAAMAAGARARSRVDIAVAITGIAGPGGSERKAEGLVFFAVSTASDTTSARCDFGALGRTPVRVASTEQALAMLLRAIPA